MRCFVALAICAGVFAFRLATYSITNDDYLHLAVAQQVLLGEVPVRDFIDPGELLFYYASAATQHAFGANLLTEVILDVSGLAVGYALLCLLAFQATRSYVLAVLVTIIAVLLLPRLYSYPKILLYPCGLALMWRYADHRRTRQLVGLGGFTALAFLVRHDHGVFIGCGAIALLALAHWTDGWRQAARRILLYGATFAVLVLPFFVFLQLNGGIVRYWRNVVQTGRAEYQRTVGPFPAFSIDRTGAVPRPRLASPRIKIRWAEGTDDATRRALAERFHLEAARDDGSGTWEYDLTDRSRTTVSALVADGHVADTAGINRTTMRVLTNPHEPNVDAWFYYLAILMPPATLAAIVLTRRRPTSGSAIMSHEVEKMTTAAVLGGLMNMFLLRAASASAIADVSTVTAVLSAYLVAHALRHWRGTVWSVMRASATLIVFAATLVVVTRADGSLELTGLVHTIVDGDQDTITDRIALLKDGAAPFDEEGARYVFECTGPADRLLVTGYVPAAYYQSGRGFAGGRPYFLRSLAPAPEYEALSLRRLQQQRVPIVLRSDDADFAGSFANIDRYLRGQYRAAGEVSLASVRFAVLVDRRLEPVRAFGPSALPCFRHAGPAGS